MCATDSVDICLARNFDVVLLCLEDVETIVQCEEALLFHGYEEKVIDQV